MDQKVFESALRTMRDDSGSAPLSPPFDEAAARIVAAGWERGGNVSSKCNGALKIAP
jgi:hypothetical protein